MGRRGDSITLSISDRDKSQLEQLALELGMMWGDRPNISKLVEAIARRQILIGLNNDWSIDRIDAIERIYTQLIDLGAIELARSIATLLVERSEISRPLRQTIESFLASPPIPWRQTLDKFIRQQQPFRLTYQDAADRLWSFTIFHASITTHERRQYIDCWCEEIDGSNEINELLHNRSLRLDRIPAEAAITPALGKWRSQLDILPVELHLSGGLALAYQAKTTDSEVEWLNEQSQPTRRAIKPVTSTFWLFREILPYAEDCEIISPLSVRVKFADKATALYLKYQDSSVKLENQQIVQSRTIKGKV